MIGQLGGYHLEHILEEDRLGTLYQATSSQNQQSVWLKRFHTPHTQSPTLQQRFLEGAQYLRNFQQSRIAEVWEVNVDPQQGPYIVLEALQGKTLPSLLHNGIIGIEVLQQIIQQIGEGLIQLHQASVLHGDLRPNNVFLHTNPTHIRILHLGHGWWWDEPLRNAGGFTNSPPVYMAPEQLQGQPWDHRVDIYACGLILAELLLGQPLDQLPHDQLLVPKQGIRLPYLLEQVTRNHQIPQLSTLLETTLHPDPNARFPNTQTFLEQFNSMMNHTNSFNHLHATEDDSAFLTSRMDVSEALQSIEGLDFSESTVIQTIPENLQEELEEPNEDDVELYTERVNISDVIGNIDVNEYFSQEHGDATRTELAAPKRPNPVQPQKAAPSAASLALKSGGSVPRNVSTPQLSPLHEALMTPLPTMRQKLPSGFGKESKIALTPESRPDPLDATRAGLKSKSSKRLLWLLFLLPLLCIGLFYGMYLSIGGENFFAQPPPRPAQPVLVDMQINSQPTGAEVLINGKPHSAPTPTTIQVPQGTKVLLQLRKKNHAPLTLTWNAQENTTREFVLQATTPPKQVVAKAKTPTPQKTTTPPRPKPKRHRPKRRKPAFARLAKTTKTPKLPRTPRTPRTPRVASAGFPTVSLSINTRPPGAKVFVGGHRWPGQTPLRVRVQKGARVKISINKYGHYKAYFMWQSNTNGQKVIQLYRHSWYNP